MSYTKSKRKTKGSKDNRDKGKYILANKSELIKKRKKAKKIKRLILLFVFLNSILITLCLKLDCFNIKSIEIYGNRNISKEEILKTSIGAKNTNIFIFNIKQLRNSIKSNPYIESISVKKNFPDKLKISIKEREASFYILDEGSYLVIDNNGIILEARKDIKKMSLVRVQGFNLNKVKTGDKVFSEDERKYELLKQFSGFVTHNKSKVKFNYIDLSDMTNLNATLGNINIKLGTKEDILKKLDSAINIIQSQNIINKKGYIDISFKGNPVVFIQ